MMPAKPDPAAREDENLQRRRHHQGPQGDARKAFMSDCLKKK
jgi:hypothetical protein